MPEKNPYRDFQSRLSFRFLFRLRFYLNFYLALPISRTHRPHETGRVLFIEERDRSKRECHAPGERVVVIGCRHVAVDQERASFDNDNGMVSG